MADAGMISALIATGRVSAEELESLVDKAREQAVELDDLLIAMGKMSDSELCSFYAGYYGYEFVEQVDSSMIDANIVRVFSIHYLKRFKVIPAVNKSGKIFLAIGRPNALKVVNDMRLALNIADLKPVFIPANVVLGAVNKVFGEVEEDLQALEMLEGAETAAFSLLGNEQIEDLLDDTSEAPFIKLVNMILSQAVRAAASDVHIEPYKDELRVRFRLDGVLYDKHSIARRFHSALVSRIKIMAKLDIAEKRLPQDGRIALTLGNRNVDLRVSCLPTTFGERIVMRLLEKDTRVMSLPELGFTDYNLERIHKLVGLSHGIILVTGPTGSGKTTSLYAILNHINSSDKNIMTIEDPVEYQLDGVGQIQVNTKTGLTFASGLRSILRQDPDVVLIGEIRDYETAEIAIQAALTGHLVFSTLHTNDAPSAVTRLIDMGVEPFLLSSVLRAVLAQRLVRRLCPDCKKASSPSGGLKRENEFLAVGCQACMDTGYRGRMALYEIMEPSETVRSLMLGTADSNQIRKQVKAEGMETLVKNGMSKAKAGLTTLSEVMRVTNN